MAVLSRRTSGAGARGSLRRSVGRVQVLLSFAVLLSGAALLLAPGAEAQDRRPQPGAAPAAGAPGVVVEKTVYVPFEKLDAVFEKEGRGIFLPYEEFLKLWTEAQPKPPAPPPNVPPVDAVVRGGVYTGTVEGDTARFAVTLDVESLKRGWSELALGFKGVAVESVELSDARALVAASTKGDAAPGYSIYMPEPGRFQAKLQLSARVTREAGKKSIAFGIPPTAVTRLEVTIPEEDVRVDVLPATAVRKTIAAGTTTQVIAYLGNASEVVLSWMPPAGKSSEGGGVIFAEQQVRAYLDERVLRVSTAVTYQVLRGETDVLRVRAPEGMRLISVKGDNIREWTQEEAVAAAGTAPPVAAAPAAEAGSGTIVVKLHSPVKTSYQLILSFERILNETPTSLAVPLPRVADVLRESGWVVLGHDSGLNVRVSRSSGLSQADKDEVPAELREALGAGFRYLAHPLVLELEVEKITPVIRSLTTSVVTLGRDEDVWVGWVDYTITKAGVFRVQLKVPSRWSVVSLGDAGSVEDFQTADDAGVRTITASLKSRAIGAFRMPFRLSAPGTAAAAEATLGPPVIVASVEDHGLFGVSSPKAFDVSTVSRENMNAADVDELFRSGILPQIAAGANLPLAYAYRGLPASVKVKLEARKTEVDLLAQHLVEISDGALKFTHILDFEILYAASDRLTFTAPSSLDAVLKVEAKEKKEVLKLATEGQLSVWQVLLQAPVVGPVSITLTHETDLKALEPGKRFTETIPLPHARDAREKGFVAVRKEGTLEVTPESTGLETIDPSDLPDKLRRGQIYGAFRYFTQEPRLTLALTRYEYQPLATAVVNLLRLESVLSEERKLRTRATFIVQNAERQYLEIDLAPESILSLAVAQKVQQPRKRQDAKGTLIQIPAAVGPGAAFPVTLVYEEALGEGSMGSLGTIALSTPTLLEGVPLSKIELDLFLPPGYSYLDWSGSLRARAAAEPTLWSSFKALVTSAAGSNVVAEQTVQRTESAPPPPAAGAIDFELPTQGTVLHRFETMAPRGSLQFRYLSRGAFRLADILAFAVALAAGIYAARKARRPFAIITTALIALPLALTWFLEDARAEVCSSVLAGGVISLAVLLVTRAWSWRADHAKASLVTAPDPFIEEAEPPRPPAKSPPPPEPEPRPGPPPQTGEGR